MALYAIGDLHLSFGREHPMDMFGMEWKDHAKKIEKYWHRQVKPTDTVVVTGDHSWGRNMQECAPDFDFFMSLPGRKILLRGNHDMFWDAKKTEALNRQFEGKLFFLQNNFYSYGAYALVGSKGICYEGKDSVEHFLKLRRREQKRLMASLDAAVRAGFRKCILFLHYPPTSVGEEESPFTLLAEQYGAEKVVYSHCHGTDHFKDSFLGNVRGVEYQLVSSDYLKFKPVKLLD